MSRLYAMGDVHGCLSQMEDVLGQVFSDAGEEEPSTLVFLGDYVDRGPDSAGVVSRLIELQARSQGSNWSFVFLIGNHEEMMFDYLDTDSIRPWSWATTYGKSTLLSYRSEGIDIRTHESWLKENGKYFHLDFVSGRPYVFVHAGIGPRERPDDMSKDDLVWTRDFQYYDGDFLDGAFVVHGHTPVEQVLHQANQMDIDTGCVFGGKLTAVRIDGDNRFQFFQS